MPYKHVKSLPYLQTKGHEAANMRVMKKALSRKIHLARRVTTCTKQPFHCHNENYICTTRFFCFPLYLTIGAHGSTPSGADVA